MKIRSEIPKKEYLESLCTKYKVPGYSFSLAKDGEILETVPVGVKNAETGIPIEKNTTFEAASITKTMFACLCSMLDIPLDKPVCELYKEDGYSNDVRMSVVTPRHMLSHGSGLPNWSARPVEFLFSPGEGFSYSGEGYYYLQRAVNHVSGKDFVEHFRDEFFVPLGMNDSAAVWNSHVYELEANAHDADGKPEILRDHVDGLGNAPEPNAAWSLYTTAEDYAKFMVYFMKNKEAFAENVRYQNKAGDNMFWGLGFGIPAKDSNVCWHWGDNGGYKNLIAMDLKNNEAVCIFSNGFNGNALEIELMEALTDGIFWRDVEEFLKTAE